jgi:hypothetical protein
MGGGGQGVGFIPGMIWASQYTENLCYKTVDIFPLFQLVN